MESALPPVICDSTNREEWLKHRKHYLGASDVPSVLGISSWKTPLQLFLEKTGALADEKEMSEAARWGLLLEPLVGQEFSKSSAFEIEAPGKMFGHRSYPFLSCTPDFLIKGANIPVQVKTANQYSADKWATGPEDRAHLQVLAECDVLGADHGYVVVLIGGQTLKWWKVSVDLQLQAFVRARCLAFWEMVLSGTPPEPVAADVETLGELFPTSRPDSLIEMPDLLPLVKELLEAQREEVAWSEKEGAARAKIQSQLGDSEGAIVGRYRVSWKSNKNGQRSFRVKEMRDGEGQ